MSDVQVSEWRSKGAAAAGAAAGAAVGALPSKLGLEPWRADQGLQAPHILSSSRWPCLLEASRVPSSPAGGVVGPGPVGLPHP